MILAEPMKRCARRLGLSFGLRTTSKLAPSPFPWKAGRAGVSFLEGVEGTRFPLLPRRVWCVRGRSPGLGARAPGQPPEGAAGGSPGLRPSRLRPLPVPSCPRPRAV